MKASALSGSRVIAAGLSARIISVALLTSALMPALSLPAAEVLTQHNDQWRSGATLSETVLSPSSVSATTFGKLFSYAVDGSVYAQPLIVQNLAIGGGTHNVVYVATMEDTVYAFDADKNTTYWQVKLTGGTMVPIPITDMTGNNNLNIHGNVGILSTPVIDRTSGTIYILARTKDTSNNTYHQRLHALNLSTGAEKFGGPVEVTTSGFNSKMQSQRTALGFANGNIYLAWASHEDFGPYHGYVMAYSATTLQQVAVFNTTASGNMGGIWQAGQGPSIDEAGNVYYMTGNGDWNGTTNFGMTFLKLSPTLRLLDWFTEADFASENASDDDLGAAGVLLVPTAAGYPATQYAVGGGKQGRIFVLDKNNGLGHMTAGDTGAHQQFQAIQTASCSHHIHGSPIYWNSAAQGRMIYVWGENDVAKGFKFNGSTFATSPFTTTTMKSPSIGCGMPGSMLSLSANGGSGGIIWANCVFSGDALHNTVPGILRAFDANNLGVELWNSRINQTRDDIGNFAKFVPPTVANGKVYMASFSNLVHVFGPVSGGPTGGGPVANGTYSLRNRSTGSMLDNLGATTDGALVGQWTDNPSPNQNWVLTNVGGSVYTLTCVTGGKLLDSLGHTTDGSTIGQWSNSGSPNQRWTISSLGGGFFKLTNVASGKCLDTGGQTANGSTMQLWFSNSSFNQQWQIVAP